VLDSNTDLAEQAGIPLYFVMEYIEGETLSDHVKNKGPMLLDEAVRVVVAILETLEIGHGVNVQHRDLKPGNIIIADGKPVVVDYGISFNKESDADWTDAGEQIGNRFIGMPEGRATGGNRRDPRSDITAACGVLYYCLTAHEPGFIHDERRRGAHRRDGFGIRDSQKNDPRVAQLEVLLDRAFEPDIEDRFQSIGELKLRLSAVQAGINPDERPVEDLSIVEARLRPRLFEQFRSVQLEAMRIHTTAVLKRLAAEFVKEKRAATLFDLSIAQVVHGFIPPPEMEPLNAGMTVTVTLRGAAISQMLIFAFAATRNQFCLCRTIVRPGKLGHAGMVGGFFGGKVDPPTIVEPSVPIQWYSGEADDAALNELATPLKIGLRKCMESFSSIELPASTP
jgi:hypothetical protein